MFYPFLLGAYIPFILIAIDRHTDEDGYPIMGLLQWVSLLVLGVYMVYAVI